MYPNLLHKQKAFSLMETLIAMALSGILLSVIYLSFRFIFKEYGMIKSKSFNGLNNYLFYSYLYKDVKRANKITKTNNNQIKLSSPKLEINYQWYTDYLLRDNGNKTDTFYIKTSQPELETFVGKNGDELIKSVKFNVTLNQDDFPIQLTKEYLPSDFFEWKDE